MTFELKQNSDSTLNEVIIDSAASGATESTKDVFFKWLSAGNAKSYSPSNTVACLDIISEYALSKKISHFDLWSIKKPELFQSIYNKLLDTKLLRVTNRGTYQTFIVAGQLYLKFLKQKPLATNVILTKNSINTVTIVEEQPAYAINKNIDPEQFVAWLITQPNMNGTLYLEDVAKLYVRKLRFVPFQLDLRLPLDERDVFACHTVEDLNTLWDTFKTAPNYKIVKSKTGGAFSAGMACLTRYLEFLTGRDETNAIDHALKDPYPANQYQRNPSLNTAFLVDFDHPEQCAQTQPLSCTIKDKAVIPNKLNWTQLLVAITEHFLREGYPNLTELERKPLYGSNPFFMPQKADFSNCAYLSNAKWINTNYNPQTVVKIIRNLCRHCDIALEDVVISIVLKNSTFKQSAANNISTHYPPTHVATQVMFEPKVLEAVTAVLSSHFQNGFRVDSPIELMRFRNFATVASADDIPLTDEVLKKVVISCGIIFEGKVYVVENVTMRRLQEEIEKEVTNGAEVFYYSSVYARHENWLLPGRIITVGMLECVLKKLYPDYLHKANYFSTKRNNNTEIGSLRNEIVRVWNNDILLSYEQISERLPYIPIEKIKLVLGQNRHFIWNSPQVYTHIGMVEISNEERSEIENYVAHACRMVCYAAISDVPLGELEARNYELSLSAIHNAVYAIALSIKYEKHGKIITRKGDTLDAFKIMKERCREIDKCTLNNLLEIERELTGETHRTIPMEAGYAVMIRTDVDTFVAEKYVHFDVERIDYALDHFVTGDYLPLKSVTTFAAFPHCGQVWNLFLLESYCRRFSRRYRFEALAVNSKNAGVIVRKSCGLACTEIMADAVAKSDIELNKPDVVGFLCNSGYIGRQSYANIETLLKQARAIRQRRD